MRLVGRFLPGHGMGCMPCLTDFQLERQPLLASGIAVVGAWLSKVRSSLKERTMPQRQREASDASAPSRGQATPRRQRGASDANQPSHSVASSQHKQ